MVKVHLIGYGKWGAVIDNAINDLNIEWVDAKDADWIIISTPNDLHYEQVWKYLRMKKNVFCEKPLTLSYKSAKELFDFADTMNVKLYVDDIFSWRKDIPQKPEQFKWTKPNSESGNLIDRLAYHHFYLWTEGKCDSDISVRSVNGDINCFRVELDDGSVGVFQYGKSDKVVHTINDEDLTNHEDNPLREMFTMIFSDSVSYKNNRFNTLNATKISEVVRKRLYPRALVVGGGIFGTTSAITLAHNGYVVELHEELDDIMKCASDINQYRLHKGYHYPRSKETAQECLDGLYTFKRKYEDSVVNGDIEHYYAISSEDSFISSDEYTTFLDEMKLPYEKVESLPNTDITIKADEELFDNWELYQSVRDKLYSSGVVVKTDTKTEKREFNYYDVVVVATYAKLNELLDNKKEYQFEVCEKPVVKLPHEYQGKSIVIMDGPFMCLDPYGDNHVLGNVVHAIHETNVGEKPIVSEELKPYLNKGVISNPEITNIDKFIETGKRFFKDFEKLRHIGSMYTIRTVLKNREQDDARPTLVNHEGNNVYSLFSGKIDTCVDAANELIKEIKSD
tara:strand:- start:456 stop:2150 length:1695 start_codon:yes stop_codon:yes gene_type:complete